MLKRKAYTNRHAWIDIPQNCEYIFPGVLFYFFHAKRQPIPRHCVQRCRRWRWQNRGSAVFYVFCHL